MDNRRTGRSRRNEDSSTYAIVLTILDDIHNIVSQQRLELEKLRLEVIELKSNRTKRWQR